MDAAQFLVPIRIKTADQPIVEIYSAEHALEFLMGWPKQEGPVYGRALSACLAASVDPESAKEAQKSFRNFARLSGILAQDMMPGRRRATIGELLSFSRPRLP